MKKYKTIKFRWTCNNQGIITQGKSKRVIARYLGRNLSTIHREIYCEITTDGTYFAEATERKIMKNYILGLILIMDMIRNVYQVYM